MKIRLFRLAPVFIFYFPFFLSATLAETITLRADTWFPFNGDPGAAEEGYMIEIAKEVFKKSGIEVDYQLMPWTRSIREAEVGHIDGIIGATVGDAPSFVYPVEPLGKIRNTFFVKKTEKWKFSGIASLNNITLGFINDYSYGATMDPYIAANANTSELVQGVGGDTALEQNIKKLMLGRITALIETPEVFYSTIAKLSLNHDDFKEAGQTPEVEEVFIAFSPKRDSSARYSKLLSDGVRELRASGELKKILARYNLKDWK